MPRSHHNPQVGLVVSLLHRWGSVLRDQGEESAPGESRVASNRSGHTHTPIVLCSGSGSHRVAETYATGLPSNEELVQMLICPAESNLKRVMKLGNGAVAAHEKATPDLGADLPYPDPQLIHLRRLLCAAHALSLLK